jgi:ribosomal protein L25 (general stress protein Ctc)
MAVGNVYTPPTDMKLFIPALLALLPLSIGTVRAAADLKAASAKIDSLVQAKLEKEKLKPTGAITDEVFVRRVFLDVVGRIPSLSETQAFLKDESADKRAKLIDSLLADEGYEQNMFNYWADILRFKSTPVGGNQSAAAGYAFADWLREALRENKPYDQMVREMVSAKGKIYENGATGYYLRDYNMPLDNMAVTTQIFLGTSMVCAQCHNHPFDKWSQMDYYQMAAHTYGMTGSNGLSNPLLSQAIYGNAEGAGYGKGAKAVKAAKGAKGAKRLQAAPGFELPQGFVRADVTRAMTEILGPLRYSYVVEKDKPLRLPHDYQYPNAKPRSSVEPLIPASFSKEGKIVKDGANEAAAYASWMTSKDNPRFTTVIANRLWKKLMGQALIEPLDEMTDSSVPSNPQLMAHLEELMKNSGYDIKAYLRTILNSNTYQQAAYAKDVEPGDVYHFPGPLLRRMSAEQIWDSMVALYKPNPDGRSIESTIMAESVQRRVEWLDRALNGLSPKELQDCSVKVAQKQKELAAEVRAAQERLSAANASKDEAAVRKAKAAIKSQRTRIDEAVDAIVYDTGMKKFATMVKEGKLSEFSSDPEFVREVTLAVKAKKGDEQLSMEEALAVLTERRRAVYAETLKARRLQDAKRLMVEPESEVQRKALAGWESLRESMFVRASDLKHPAPNGHFLREFGQSDRELTENANDEASVSQALMLLNGKVFSYLMNPYTQVTRAMAGAKAKGSDAVIDAVYLSLLSRNATEEEKTVLREIADNADATDRGDVLWTVLNTRQFFFIQ